MNRAFSALLVALAPIFYSGFALASIEIVSERTLESPATAKMPQTLFKEFKKKVRVGSGPANQAMWMTDTRFAYNAESPSKIEDVAIVQWIRGCMFRSQAANGKITKSLSITREHFGKTVTFQHRDWNIDSDSSDPIYTSYQTQNQSFGRFALLRWNTNPASLNPETSRWYGQMKPPHGIVFATDLPGGGFLATGSGHGEGASQNASLEFKTCLFNTTDLPETTTPRGRGIDQAKALWCVNWEHKFVWDFSRAKMTSPAQIDSFCQAK